MDHELLATDHQGVLEFFVVGLKNVSEPTVERRELLYNASVLAHYAQVSTASANDLPIPPTLSTVFDHFVMDASLHDDSSMMEVAGAQVLVLSGFFEDQMSGRHNIAWYAKLGATFFGRAARFERTRAKAHLLGSIARTFEPWRDRHARLSRELRDRRYLLTPPEPPDLSPEP